MSTADCTKPNHCFGGSAYHNPMSYTNTTCNEARRAVPLDNNEKKTVSLLQAMSTIKKNKVHKTKVKNQERKEKTMKERLKEEAARKAALKPRKEVCVAVHHNSVTLQRMYRMQGLRQKRDLENDGEERSHKKRR